MAKYKNRKITVDGVTYDSQKEYRRYKELLLSQDAGKIRGLERQVQFVLTPTQRELPTATYKRGINKGKLKPGKIIERPCMYFADFAYTDVETGEYVVEDTKGMRTKEYIIKRKMMLFIHGIRIKEI